MARVAHSPGHRSATVLCAQAGTPGSIADGESSTSSSGDRKCSIIVNVGHATNKDGLPTCDIGSDVLGVGIGVRASVTIVRNHINVNDRFTSIVGLDAEPRRIKVCY